MKNFDDQDITTRAVELIESLCQIDSRTTDSPDGATAAGVTLGQVLEPMGFECEQIPCKTNGDRRGDHLLAVRNPGAKTKIFLTGHTDTVLSPEEAPFRYDASAGRVYGSGVCDMKGGLVLMAEAVRMALADENFASNAEIVILVNASEEKQSEFFGTLICETCRDARACLCFEGAFVAPDGTQIMPNSRKGILRARLSCKGVSGHAGNAHPHGANAIREIARKVEIIETTTDYDRALTANVGIISGGHSFNQIPDEAAVEFEIRGFDPELMQATKEELTQKLTQPTVRSADGKNACELSIEWSSGFPPYPQNPGTDDLLNRYIRLAEQEGLRVISKPRGGASDASFVWKMLPTLDGLGPICGGLHSPEEWADIQTFPARVKATAGLLCELAKK